MNQTSQEQDNESVHSNDSHDSTGPKEKLESLINMELKHSNVLNNLILTNKILRLDLENLNDSCQRFESHIKEKTELSEKYYEKLIACQKRNKIQLKEKSLLVTQKLEKVNSKFSQAFDIYSSAVLKNSINDSHNRKENLEKILMETTQEVKAFQPKLIKPSKKSEIECVKNMLFELSMKRPEIQLEDTSEKMVKKIQKLEQKRQELKAKLKRHNK